MFESAFKPRTPNVTAKLNLVALMDIFTILVFFLLLNSGEAEKLESARFVTLPDSHAGGQPHNDLVVLIDQDAIWFGDDMLVSLEELGERKESAIPELQAALAAHRERRSELSSFEEEHGLSLTIMGDQEVSYSLLKTVMVTCRLEDFRNIALAVNRVSAPAIEGMAPSPALAAGSIGAQGR